MLLWITNIIRSITSHALSGSHLASVYVYITKETVAATYRDSYAK